MTRDAVADLERAKREIEGVIANKEKSIQLLLANNPLSLKVLGNSMDV